MQGSIEGLDHRSEGENSPTLSPQAQGSAPESGCEGSETENLPRTETASSEKAETPLPNRASRAPVQHQEDRLPHLADARAESEALPRDRRKRRAGAPTESHLTDHQKKKRQRRDPGFEKAGRAAPHDLPRSRKAGRGREDRQHSQRAQAVDLQKNLR